MSPSLLYLKPLRNGDTFLHLIYKSKKKERNTLYLSVNAFSTKVPIGTLFLTSSTSSLFQAFR